MRVSPTNAEFHWVREHMNTPSQPQQTGVCPALLLGWTPPGCSCQSCCLSSHICWEVEGVLRAGLPDAVVWLLDCAHQAHDSLSRQDHSEHFVVYILCSSLDSVQITGANTESRVTPATALYMHPQMICANFCSPMKKALFQPHL